VLNKQKLAEIKKLHQKKFREESGLFLIEGWKSIQEAINAGIKIETLLYDEQKATDKILLGRFEKVAKETHAVKAKEIESISDTVTSQGIVAVVPKFSSINKLESILKQDSALIIALDSINDPGNLGTIIRTCDWFGIDALVIGKNSVELYNPKVVRATMGSLFHFPIIDDFDLKEFLTQCRSPRFASEAGKESFAIYSSELSNSEDLRNVTVAKKSVVIIGSESHGVSKEISELADKKISIPKFGKAESLNAAMACGIILSQIRLR